MQLWHLKSQVEEDHRPSVTFTLGGGHTDGTDDLDEPDRPQGMTSLFKFERLIYLFFKNKSKHPGNASGVPPQLHQLFI